ncbi:MAG: GNAT family N-acetyltransferase [Deltaproteobacteria bacterium]|nr:GNAT family N-acetyltransferase [Deltaproteobacteria bacterium]
MDEKSINESILPWIEAAGNPYYDWLFQDPATTTFFMKLWIRNRQSEIFIARIHALFVDDQIAGGFIALNGKNLSKCRQVDAKYLITKSNLKQRKKIMLRLSLSDSLFPIVSEDEYYLSKIGINPSFRCKGYGSLLMDKYLEQGGKSGLNKYRLDVFTENQIAIKCYEKCGFKIDKETTTKNGELKYFSMTYKE